MFTASHITNQRVFSALLESKKLVLWIKRLDKIHPHIPGNKFFKLKYNMEAAIRQGYKQILTFGGAYSNHLHACASASALMEIKATGVIRGESLTPLNPTLEHAKSIDMELHFISREDYRKKNTAEVIHSLKEKFGDFYLIPEGGTNELAIKGCKEILHASDKGYDFVCSSIGTGGTFCGILSSAAENQTVLGFSSLKGEFIHQEIDNLIKQYHLETTCQKEIFSGYHFGGYAKQNSKLIEFIQAFYADTKIPLDPIYTGKMMYGIMDLVRKDYFPENSQILAIHSGGLQGIKGFNQRFGTDLREA